MPDRPSAGREAGPFTCPRCDRVREFHGYSVASEPVCRGCWLDAKADDPARRPDDAE
jgi:uncharacterized protein (DUF983 family)